MKLGKRQFIIGFFAVTVLLACLRLLFPGIARIDNGGTGTRRDSGTVKSVAQHVALSADTAAAMVAWQRGSQFLTAGGVPVKSKIFSVPGFQQCFPDQQDVQLQSALQWGLPISLDSAASSAKPQGPLVYVGSNPYYYVERLKSSSPYLVPRAALLLQDIGQAFFDSLQVKRIPLHKIIVTSVMRTKSDVEKLQGHNRNATTNSCHLYGTTFDVCYNRYKTVCPPGETRREVRNDTLKWVLAEVLRDMREQDRCHIKYEVNQGCWHITVR